MTSRVVKLTIIAAMVAMLSSCFSTSWLITLKRDGSGTIRMEYRMDKQVIQMMQSMGGEDADTPTTSADFIDQEELDGMAAEMGSGVRYVSAEPLNDDEDSIGYSALFEFDDINTLGIDPMQSAPEQQSSGFEEDEGEEAPPYAFRFTPGSPSRLVIMMAQDEGEEDSSQDEGSQMDSEGTEGQDQEMMAEMMKPYFRSMSFVVQLRIDGTLLETDATYRDGNTITLMDMDMGKIVDNDELFKEVINAGDISDDEMVAKLESAGVRIENKDRISVSFR